MNLTKLDKNILNILQGRLPIASRPYQIIGQELGITEEEVISRIEMLKEHGYIRKIGAFFNSENLGYQGALIALEVAEGYMESVAEYVNTFSSITHNYQREGNFNLWFTLITDSVSQRENILQQIGHLPGVLKLLDLQSNKKYKINVQFQLK